MITILNPISPRELVARVRALLCRRLREGARSQSLRTKSFALDLEQHRIT